jgi:hypothetical protein
MTLENHTCGKCGIEFAAPDKWWAERRKNHDTWYCPNGHSRSFIGETKEDALRRERDLLTQRLAQKDDEIAGERRRTEAAREATAKAERKLKRVQKGVCPCCTRSFTNLARHMATKHPDTKPKLIAKKVRHDPQ